MRIKSPSAYRRTSSILALQLETLEKFDRGLTLSHQLVLPSEMEARVRLAHRYHDRSLQSVYRGECVKTILNGVLGKTLSETILSW